jgi:hypothetical protein
MGNNAKYREYLKSCKVALDKDVQRFLCGKKNRALFRYLNPPLDRLRMKHPQKTRLIVEVAKAASCNRTRETHPGHPQ